MRRGDEEFVRAALVTLTAMEQFDREPPETLKQDPTHATLAVYVLLKRIFESLKTAYPDVERIQRAALDLDVASEGLRIDSDIFTGYYMTLGIIPTLTDEVLEKFEGLVYRGVQDRAHFFAEKMLLAADPSVDASELPTREDFGDLCQWLARDGFDIAVTLSFIENSDVVFGVEPDGTVPVQGHFQHLKAYTEFLEAALAVNGSTSPRAAVLRRVAFAELRLLLATLAQGWDVFVNVDGLEDPEPAAARLSDWAARACLPKTREIAGEHMSYLYNRAASAAQTQDLAESFHSAAVASSHYAYENSGTPRHAKYIAQNVLEIARLRRDDFLTACAETVWVDAYVVPYHLGLHSSRTRVFEKLGWTAPTYVLSGTRFDYTDIPPHSVDPAFVYEGPAAEGLRELAPGFTLDLWAAAALVVQRFKDLESPIASAVYDAALPIYVPDAEGPSRFPMLHQHPVAWFFLLADRLLAEHLGNHPNAGLSAARRPEWEQRRWLKEVLDDYRMRLSGQPVRGARSRATFPTLAAHLLRPVVDEWRKSGRERLAAQWSEIVRLWSVDRP